MIGRAGPLQELRPHDLDAHNRLNLQQFKGCGAASNAPWRNDGRLTSQPFAKMIRLNMGLTFDSRAGMELMVKAATDLKPSPNRADALAAPPRRNLPPPAGGGARQLQTMLPRALWSMTEPRWSARQTLMFIVVVCGLAWAAIGLLVWWLAHR
ncbi:MAG TPA: hypothetical protein VF459_20455 [Caulobacteraceae bacterium]